MKLFQIVSALSMALMPVLALVPPTPATESLERRAGVSCTGKYVGKLYLNQLNAGETGKRVGLATWSDANQYLRTGQDQQYVKFQFDKCKTSGWNRGGDDFGQLKPLNLVDQTLCVTSTSGTSYKGSLYITPCSDYNGGKLEYQWFYANYQVLGNGTANVEIQLNGNPNDNSYGGYRPFAYAKNNYVYSSTGGGEYRTLNLREVQIIS